MLHLKGMERRAPCWEQPWTSIIKLATSLYIGKYLEICYSAAWSVSPHRLLVTKNKVSGGDLSGERFEEGLLWHQYHQWRRNVKRMYAYQWLLRKWNNKSCLLRIRLMSRRKWNLERSAWKSINLCHEFLRHWPNSGFGHPAKRANRRRENNLEAAEKGRINAIFESCAAPELDMRGNKRMPSCNAMTARRGPCVGAGKAGEGEAPQQSGVAADYIFLSSLCQGRIMLLLRGGHGERQRAR